MNLSGFPAHVETQTIDWSGTTMAHMGTTVDVVFTGWDRARVVIALEQLHDVRDVIYDYTRMTEKELRRCRHG